MCMQLESYTNYEESITSWLKWHCRKSISSVNYSYLMTCSVPIIVLYYILVERDEHWVHSATIIILRQMPAYPLKLIFCKS